MTKITVERELLERVTDGAEHGIGIDNADLIALRAILSAQPVEHIRTDNTETLRNALAEIERLKKTVAHWQGLAVANRKVADDALAAKP